MPQQARTTNDVTRLRLSMVNGFFEYDEPSVFGRLCLSAGRIAVQASLLGTGQHALWFGSKDADLHEVLTSSSYGLEGQWLHELPPEVPLVHYGNGGLRHVFGWRRAPLDQGLSPHALVQMMHQAEAGYPTTSLTVSDISDRSAAVVSGRASNGDRVVIDTAHSFPSQQVVIFTRSTVTVI